jgi:hypothetical protein
VVTLDDPQPIARATGRWRTVLRVVVCVFLVLLGSAGLAVEQALSAPGNDPAPAKIAEWARDNGLGGLVTWLVVTAHGRPAVQVAALRPDGLHTSYVVACSAWIPPSCAASCTPALATPAAPGRRPTGSPRPSSAGSRWRSTAASG